MGIIAFTMAAQAPRPKPPVNAEQEEGELSSRIEIRLLYRALGCDPLKQFTVYSLRALSLSIDCCAKRQASGTFLQEGDRERGTVGGIREEVQN